MSILALCVQKFIPTTSDRLNGRAAEDRLPAIRAGRGGKFWIPRIAIEKFAERLR